MNSKNTVSRSTLGKQIKKAAHGENIPFNAHQMAMWGRILSPLEEKFSVYYGSKAALKCKSTEMPWRFESAIESFKLNIFEEFLSAIDRYEFQKMQEIAEVIRFFKSKKWERSNPNPVDWEREALLELKILLDGQKVKIRDVAAYLAKKKHGNDKGIASDISVDGFSALRRTCKELNFPLADSRKIRRK